MNLDEQISKRVDKGYRFELWNENVIRFPDQNTLNTKVKQIRNPQKEISGGFLFLRYKFKMLGKKIKFKIPNVPSKKFLKGKFVILEPVDPSKHGKDLFETFSLDKQGLLWKYMPDGPFKNLKQLNHYLKNTDCFFYAIYSKRHKKYCGLASYLRIQPKAGSIEVGYITYSPILRKTVEATETMYLMMKNVFETLKYRRYEWKCNNGNEKSKNAALRLGFRFEGVFRQAAVVKGRNRDTAWFSVIDKEWKKLKKGYLRYFSNKNLDKNFNQKKSLKFR